MAVTVQLQCPSAVTALYEGALVGSSMENGTTMITVALRQHDVHQALGTQARLCWRQESSHVDGHALSPLPNPLPSRCISAQGSSLAAQHPRRSFPPELKGVSTSQHMRHRVLRLAALCLMPMTTWCPVCRRDCRHPRDTGGRYLAAARW